MKSFSIRVSNSFCMLALCMLFNLFCQQTFQRRM